MSVAAKQRVSVLGITGSIGRSTADILVQHPERFSVQALTAMDNVKLLAKQARELNAHIAVIGNPAHYQALKDALNGSGIGAAAGETALIEAAQMPSDTVVAAIVGAAGLKPTMAAVKRGARVALANKECLVMAGDLILKEAARSHAALIPVDSEHSAIFQALEPSQIHRVARITLTASGGPFRSWSVEQMAKATPAQAVKHPNWSMGAKISVDSATLMNKGLEWIEACRLFPVPQDRIDMIVHPESIIHGLVAYEDGSVIAQMGAPDMRTPIAYALAWPERLATRVEPLDLIRCKSLTFEPVDTTRFPAPALARAALEARNSMPAILNAANEIAVDAFLQGAAAFTDIVKIVEKTMEKAHNDPVSTIEDIVNADANARRIASSLAH